MGHCGVDNKLARDPRELGQPFSTVSVPSQMVVIRLKIGNILLRRLAASASLSVAYGQHLVSESSYQIVQRIKDFVHVVSTAAAPATAPLVEILPILNWLPAWLAAWKREGQIGGSKFNAMYEEFLDDARSRMVSSSSLLQAVG